VNYKRKDIDLAYSNIRTIIDKLMIRYQVNFKPSSNAPSTYKAMRSKRDENGYFVVYNGGDHGLLGEDYNIKFRALHDFMHYKHNLSFKFEDERKLSDITMITFSEMAWGELNITAWQTHCIRQVIDREIRGQIDYFETRGHYVPNQSVFILDHFNL